MSQVCFFYFPCFSFCSVSGWWMLFSPLKLPEETPQVSIQPLQSTCICSLYCKTVLPYPAWEHCYVLLFNFIFLCCIIKLEKFGSSDSSKSTSILGSAHMMLGLSLYSSVLQVTDQIVPAFSRLALVAHCVQDPTEPGGGSSVAYRVGQVCCSDRHFAQLHYSFWLQLMKRVQVINGETR